MMINQPLVWGELGLGTLALIPLQNLHYAIPIPGLIAYVGAGVIYLLYLVHHVQSLFHQGPLVMSQTWTQHLDLHPWRLLQDLSDLNQVMRLQTQPPIPIKEPWFMFC